MIHSYPTALKFADLYYYGKQLIIIAEDTFAGVHMVTSDENKLMYASWSGV